MAWLSKLKLFKVIVIVCGGDESLQHFRILRSLPHLEDVQVFRLHTYTHARTHARTFCTVLRQFLYVFSGKILYFFGRIQSGSTESCIHTYRYMHVYIHIHTHIHTLHTLHTYITYIHYIHTLHTYITYIHTHCIHRCIHTVCIHRLYTYIHTHIRMCVYVCTHHIHIDTYVHIHYIDVHACLRPYISHIQHIHGTPPRNTAYPHTHTHTHISSAEVQDIEQYLLCLAGSDVAVTYFYSYICYHILALASLRVHKTIQDHFLVWNCKKL